MRLSTKAATVATAAALLFVPSSASAQGTDPEVNPGSENSSREEARAIGRDECGEFKQNFGENRKQFGECVSAVAKVLRTDKTPRQACRAANLRKKPAEGEKRSDFSACVAAARGANGGRES
jgi:uncharacterized protein YcfJ